MSENVVENSLDRQVVESYPDSSAPIAVYALYLAGLLFGVTGIIGVVVAYISRSELPEWQKSHAQYQIRTFWIGLLFMFIGTLTAIIVVGYLILFFWVVWLIIRCVKGIDALSSKRPITNPQTWMF